MCAYSKEKKVGFSFKVCLGWQCDLGLCSSWFCGPRGRSCKPPFATYKTRWTLPTEASSTAPSGHRWGPNPLLSCFPHKRSPMRKQTPSTPRDPNGQMPMDFLGKVDEFFEWQHRPRFQCSSNTTALSRPAVKPSLKSLAVWCGWGRPKEGDQAVRERAGTWVRDRQLLHGSALGPGAPGDATRESLGGKQNKNLGHGNLHYQCEQPAFLLHLRML